MGCKTHAVKDGYSNSFYPLVPVVTSPQLVPSFTTAGSRGFIFVSLHIAMTNPLLNPKKIVQIGIDRGWIKPAPPVVEENEPIKVKVQKKLNVRKYVRERRSKFHSKGLNSSGKPRRKKERPELLGLSGREYHRLHMQIWRKEMAVKTK